MTDLRMPGACVEEVAVAPPAIAAVDVSTALFVGPVAQRPQPNHELRCSADFERAFGTGGAGAPDYLAWAAKAFFDNGGRRLWVQPVDTADGPGYAAALAASRAIAEVGLVAAPGASTLAARPAVEAALVEHANALAATAAPRFVLLDAAPGLDPSAVLSARAALPETRHAALFYPWWLPAGGAPPQPPSGAIAGVIARVDALHGVHHAPGGEKINGAAGLERRLSNHDGDALNPAGVDVLRSFTDGNGRESIRLWGVRTISSDPEWRYLSLRRYVDQVSRSIQAGLDWTVFEPNAEPLWARVRAAIENFLYTEWCNGALQGLKPQQAYSVRCDRTTMTQADFANGRLVVLAGLALLRPAEFVTLRIAATAAPA